MHFASQWIFFVELLTQHVIRTANVSIQPILELLQIFLNQ